MSIDPHMYAPDCQAMGDCRVCGHDAAAPWHNFEASHRAATLRKLMEAKWTAPGVSNSHRRCKWTLPLALGGDHGHHDDIADDNVPIGRGR